MERAKLYGPSLRGEVMAVVGTIVVMVLSFVGVVVLCASTHVETTAAKIVYATPAASAAGDLGLPAAIAGVGVQVIGPR